MTQIALNSYRLAPYRLLHWLPIRLDFLVDWMFGWYNEEVQSEFFWLTEQIFGRRNERNLFSDLNKIDKFCGWLNNLFISSQHLFAHIQTRTWIILSTEWVPQYIIDTKLWNYETCSKQIQFGQCICLLDRFGFIDFLLAMRLNRFSYAFKLNTVELLYVLFNISLYI